MTMPEPTPGQVARAAFWTYLAPEDGDARVALESFDTRSPAAWEAAAQAVLAPAHTARNAVYTERNMLVGFLSTCYPSHLARHPEEEPWEDEWRWLVCVHTPAGQMTWHIHDSERQYFAHLSTLANDWNGHSTAEKYTSLWGLILQQSQHKETPDA